jgi:alcohol dehydrogenase class IV
MDHFHYTGAAQEILFGPGALAQLGEAVERWGWRRLMLCSTGSQRRGGQIAQVERALGERLAATYERVQPHVPEAQVTEALALAQERMAEAIIGLGGGSPIGLAKAVSFGLEEQRSGKPALPGDMPLVPVVAVPTTYAGSEMTPVYGVTRQVDGVARKITVTDSRIAPRLVIYDPQLTLDLPPEMTASTGINALAHCMEALYSITRNPLSTAAALGGLRAMLSALPRCWAAGDDLEARTQMLSGAYLAGVALAHVSMALHHGICHVLGGTVGVPHGVANSIILPHALRFNLEATAPQLAQAAEAMGIARAGQSAAAAAEAAIERIEQLIGELRLPRRLRDAGVQEADLRHLAAVALQSRAVQSNPRPVRDAAELEALLRAAW